MKAIRLLFLIILGFAIGITTGWLFAVSSRTDTLTHLLLGQAIIAEEWGDAENTGRKYAVLLTKELPTSWAQQEDLQHFDGPVFLQILEPYGGRFRRKTKLYVGDGVAGDLVVGHLAGGRMIEIFTFANGQATQAHVFRFYGTAFRRLFAIEQGRSSVQCRRGKDGKWDIIERARLDYYDDVPDSVAREAKLLGKVEGNVLPSIVRVYRSYDGDDFELTKITAERSHRQKLHQ